MQLLNGTVEIGLRTLAILMAMHPRRADMGAMVTLDYLLIHSGDVADGPESLHPPSPLRAGEVAVRRQLIADGIALYRSRGLVTAYASADGVEYGLGEFGAAFYDALGSGYSRRLRDRAGWLHELAAERDFSELAETLDAALRRWQQEFAFFAETDPVNPATS